ncbi:MAG: histone deacetylase [Chitinivibrionales bacterium]|nr:histone deacetylase [Chitinivibrionales bacterium]
MPVPTFNRRAFLDTTIQSIIGLGLIPSYAAPFRRKGDMQTCGYVYDPLFLDHSLGVSHPESPDRLRWINRRLEQSGILAELTQLSETVEPESSILDIHTREHHDSVNACDPTGAVAQYAVASILGAVKAVSEGTVTNAFCAIRPPGHHAYNNGAGADGGSCSGEGFCFYSNAAIAARYAQNVMNHEKVLIVDWDYHHGNGTEEAFYADPSVLFFSTHNQLDYPGTGDPRKTGTEEGEGFTINVHMSERSGNDEFLGVWHDTLLPAAESFQPDFIIISAGFDSKRDDRLGYFDITPHGFSSLTKPLMDLADSCCNGKIVSILEGGYSDGYSTLFHGLACAVDAHITTLATGEIQPETDCSVKAAKQKTRSGGHPGLSIRNNSIYVPENIGEIDTVRIVNSSGQTILRLDGDTVKKQRIRLPSRLSAQGAYLVHISFCSSSKTCVIPYREVR